MPITEYQKTNHTLPQDVVSAFQGMDTETRNAYIVALRDQEWTLQSIADAAGITRERVRQLVQRAPSIPADQLGAPLPAPPAKVYPEPRTFIEPDPDKLARMLELKDAAQNVRLNSTNNREEAEEYTALIADVHLNDGVTLYRLAKRLGVTHGALRFRLARYGYKTPSKANPSKVYKPIKTENRPNK